MQANIEKVKVKQSDGTFKEYGTYKIVLTDVEIFYPSLFKVRDYSPKTEVKRRFGWGCDVGVTKEIHDQLMSLGIIVPKKFGKTRYSEDFKLWTFTAMRPEKDKDGNLNEPPAITDAFGQDILPSICVGNHSRANVSLFSFEGKMGNRALYLRAVSITNLVEYRKDGGDTGLEHLYLKPPEVSYEKVSEEDII